MVVTLLIAIAILKHECLLQPNCNNCEMKEICGKMPCEW